MAVTGKSLGTLLGTRLGVRLGTDLAPNVAASFSDATFTNASDRYLSYGSTAPSVVLFAGGTLATRVINGKRYAQIESASENVLTKTQAINHGDWIKTRSTISADDLTDPLNTTTADKLVEDGTVANTHLVRQSKTPDGASQYCFSVYGSDDERDWIRQRFAAAGFVGTPNHYSNIATGVSGTTLGLDDYGIENAGGGWYRPWMTATSDAAAASGIDVYLCDDDNSASYDGDGSSGAHLWNPQMEIGSVPSSPVLCDAAPVVRAKDQLYWASADLPAAMLGKFTFKWIPWDDNTGGNRYLWYNGAAGNRFYCYYYGTTDKIRVRGQDPIATYVESNALTFSRLQELTITVDPAEGSIEVAGATLGDGKNTTTSWSPTAGDFYWGMTNATANQCEGLISEPY